MMNIMRMKELGGEAVTKQAGTISVQPKDLDSESSMEEENFFDDDSIIECSGMPSTNLPTTVQEMLNRIDSNLKVTPGNKDTFAFDDNQGKKTPVTKVKVLPETSVETESSKNGSVKP